MRRDNRGFVGGYAKGLHGASVGGQYELVTFVGSCVRLNAEPVQPTHDFGPYGRGVLPDPRGEDNCIDTIEVTRQPGNRPCDRRREVLQRFSRRRLLARQQISHVQNDLRPGRCCFDPGCRDDLESRATAKKTRFHVVGRRARSEP